MNPALTPKTRHHFTRMSSTLIERAMEMRAQAYLNQAKHDLLMETIMGMHSVKEGLVRHNQNLTESGQLKNLFIAGMSHELNNPLTAIIGYSEMLASEMAGPLNEKQRCYLGNVLDSARHLQGLVSDAMDIAKIEANRIEPQLSTFELDEALADAVAQVRQRAEEKRLPVRTLPHPRLTLTSDRRRLVQCLINLLTNAIKYCERGEVTIAAEAQGEKVAIAISDTGIGMSEDDLQHLFEAFNRGANAIRSAELGTGIGLFLTNKLVNNVLGGSIGVTSRLNQGSTFTLTIPVQLTITPAQSA